MRSPPLNFGLEGGVLGDLGNCLAAPGDDDVVEHAPVQVAAHRGFRDVVVQHAGDHAHAPEQFVDEGRIYRQAVASRRIERRRGGHRVG